MISYRDGDSRVEILVGERRITAFQPTLDALRARMGYRDDMTTSPQRLLLWAAISAELPVVVTLQRSGEFYGIVLMTIRRWRGIPIGFAHAGNLAGQGGVVAAPADRRAALEMAARTLLRTYLVHTVLVSVLQTHPALPDIRSAAIGIHGQWHFREIRIRLSLAGGLPAVFNALSYKMRRNVRYYRKRADEELGLQLVSDMTTCQRRSAVMALHGGGPYPVDTKKAEKIDVALQKIPGCFAMGLQDRAGNWISYITGWRAAGATYVDWQLNSGGHANASISTVMRAYLLEHEVDIGSDAIIFVGLTNPFWARACEVQTCADLAATRGGLLGAMTRRLAVRVSPNGRVAALLGSQENPLAKTGFEDPKDDREGSLVSVSDPRQSAEL